LYIEQELTCEAFHILRDASIDVFALMC